MVAHLIVALIWTFICVLPQLVAGEQDIFCSGDLFGQPVANDCKEAMKWIPYFMSPSGGAKNPATALRLFVEPQFMDLPFSPVSNPYSPLAIVQLPKIWKHSMLYSSLKMSPGGFIRML